MSATAAPVDPSLLADEYLSYHDLTERYGWSLIYIRQQARAGRLAVQRRSGVPGVLKSDLIAFIRATRDEAIADHRRQCQSPGNPLTRKTAAVA